MTTIRRRAGLLASAGAMLALAVGCAQPPADVYVPPNPLPAAANGDVFKSATFAYKNDANVKASYVLYRSTNATGQPMAVSGTVLVPTTPYDGVRPIVGVGPFTLGAGDRCAQSKGIAGGDGVADEALKRGWAVAITDYEGLGTPGRHTYMVGQSQGRAVLDAVRAATRLPGSGLSPSAPVGIAGYSQGGASAGWAGELAATYAPELQVKGVVAGGTPADLIKVGESLEGSFFYGFANGAAYGFDAAYPELDLENYLNDAGRQELAKADDQCVADILLAYAFKRISDYTTTNPLKDPKWIARLNENKLGSRTPSTPTLLFHGTGDQVIPIGQAQTLREAYCARGATVQWSTTGSDHVFGLTDFPGQFGPYLADRFAGKPAPSNC